MSRPRCAPVLGLLVLLAGSPAGAVTLNPLGDGIALGVSAAFGGASELVVRFAPRLPETPAATWDSLPAIDRALMFPYSPAADSAGTVLDAAAMAIAVVMALATGSTTSALADVAAYAEAAGLALGGKNFMKYLLPRYRPYVFEGGAQGVDPSEDNQAFPSGHTTMAFATAGFSAYLFLEGLPGTGSLLRLVCGG